MSELLRYCAGLLLCAALLPAHAATPYTRIEANYDVTKGVRIATISETYTRAQNRYHLESISQAVGLLAMIKNETITVISDGTVTENGLRPDVASGTRKLDTQRNVKAEFDWTAKTVTLHNRDGVRTLPLPPNTQDRLSTMYQFMFLGLKENSTVDFYMSDGTDLDPYGFRADAELQSVTVPAGTFRALHVSSTPQPGRRSREEIWLATDYANLPCKMLVVDSNGHEFTQVLTQLKTEP